MAEPIKKLLQLNKVSYYEVHLALVNAMLPIKAKLTEMEIKVLAMFMSFEEDIPLGRFGTYSRKIVMDKLGIQMAGLSNYLKALKLKRFIVEKEGKLELIHVVKIPKDEQIYMFKLINIEQ